MSLRFPGFSGFGKAKGVGMPLSAYALHVVMLLLRFPLVHSYATEPVRDLPWNEEKHCFWLSELLR